jgi:hypothetical protein
MTGKCLFIEKSIQRQFPFIERGIKRETAYSTAFIDEAMVNDLGETWLFLFAKATAIICHTLKYHLFLLAAVFYWNGTMAQELAFRHLDIDEGMPSNSTTNACFDSSGLVWIGTNDGLIRYDGTRVQQYVAETHPGLAVNDVDFLYCDSRNRIWICTGEGLSVLDEHRRIKKITISDTLRNKLVTVCFEVAGVGMVAIAPNRTYLLPENKTNWEPFNWVDEKVRQGSDITKIRLFNKTSFMFISGKRAMLVDFATRKILTAAVIEDAGSVCKLNNRELLVIALNRFELYRVEISTGSVIKKYAEVKDAEGISLRTATINCDVGANGFVYIATRSVGLIGFDALNEKFYTYRHQPLNKTSISADNLRRVHCHGNGYMTITSTTGLNFTNVLTPTLYQQNKFADEKGNIIDNVIMVAEDAR